MNVSAFAVERAAASRKQTSPDLSRGEIRTLKVRSASPVADAVYDDVQMMHSPFSSMGDLARSSLSVRIYIVCVCAHSTPCSLTRLV